MHHVAHTLAFGLTDRRRDTKSEQRGTWSLLWFRLTAWRRPSTVIVRRRLSAYI